MARPDWAVYVLVSDTSATTYVGISNDPLRRLEQHNGERPGGAKATRAGRPWRFGAIYGPFPTRGEAQSAEHEVKRKRGRDRMRASFSRCEATTFTDGG